MCPCCCRATDWLHKRDFAKRSAVALAAHALAKAQSPKPKAQSQFWACLFAAQKFAHKKAPVFFIGKTGAVARQQLRQ